MSAPVPAADVERFRGIVAARFGLQFDDTRLGFLADVLRRRVDHGRAGSGQYLSRLEESGSDHREAGALARELTIGETYFFRNVEQFRALAEVALPERLRDRAADRCLRILSAGCASGEEAYTIAMIVKDAVDPSWDVSIRAVDLNPGALERAALGRYNAWALRETLPAVRDRWFQPAGSDLILVDAIRSAVTFESRNITVDDPDLWRRESYDIVFCRNVLMYFSPETMSAVVKRIAASVARGGYLFLGHAESLRGTSRDFVVRQSHDTFYYQRPLEDLDDEPPVSVQPSTLPPGAAIRVPDTQRPGAPLRAAPAVPSSAPAPVSAGREAARLLDLVRDERFAEALALVQASEDLPHDCGLQLTAAMLLVHSGEVGAAAGMAGRILARDSQNAGAHYVLALADEAAGDPAAAAGHDRLAVFLDPDFSMPHLHLGLLAKRAGDGETARRELGHALLHLGHDDADRLLLFGGGFTRDALMTLCRAELAALEGRA